MANTNYKQGDGHYRKHLQKEAENEFIDRAVKAIEAGCKWDRFLQQNPQYTIANTAKWHVYYDQMTDRRNKSKVGTWGLETEMQLARNRRFTEAQREADEKTYQALKEGLLSCAVDHKGWTETKRELRLTDLFEPMFRRAQQEAGVSKVTERDDPFESAFADGFFG